jgi:hypothetical protein
LEFLLFGIGKKEGRETKLKMDRMLLLVPGAEPGIKYKGDYV